MKATKTQKNWIYLLVAAVVVALVPILLQTDYQMMVVNRLLINIVVVLGLNFITGLTGQMNLGTAGIFAIGAYASAIFTQRTGATPWLGLLVSMMFGLLIGLGLGYPSLRVKGVYLSLTTIGFAETIRMLLANLDKLTGGTQGIREIPPYTLFGFAFNTHKRVYFLFVVFAAFAFFFAYRIVNSKWGRVFKSLRDNVEAVEMGGVNIARVKITAFTLAAVFGTVAGSLYAHYMGYINPSSFNTDLSANYVIMLMVGGIGSVFGNIFGAVVVTILPEALRFLGTYYQLVFAIIILLGAIFIPNGWVDALKRLLLFVIHKTGLRRKEDVPQ